MSWPRREPPSDGADFLDLWTGMPQTGAFQPTGQGWKPETNCQTCPEERGLRTVRPDLPILRAATHAAVLPHAETTHMDRASPQTNDRL